MGRAVTTKQNQAAVSATGLAAVNSDDPDTVALSDPTVTLLEQPPPRLAIRRTLTNTVVVSWPSPSTGFALQQNGSLAGGSWAAAAEPVTDNGTNKFIIVNPPTANRFTACFDREHVHPVFVALLLALVLRPISRTCSLTFNNWAVSVSSRAMEYGKPGKPGGTYQSSLTAWIKV